MVYSASDKNYEVVRLFKELAEADHIALQPLLIHSLADLYSLAHAVHPETEALFIAKDHLVASGASSLAQAAERLKIPLITSDEGSVLAGGAAAIGNRELDLGRRGGELAIRLLEGSKRKDIPLEPLELYTIFANREVLEKQGLSLEQIQQAADRLECRFELLEAGGSSP